MDKKEKEWWINASEAAIRDRLADKVADGTLVENEIDLVVHYLISESQMESAYKVLCRRLWFSTEPSTFNLTPEESELMEQLFPREQVKKKGRPATGTGSGAIMMAVAENMYFAETGNKRKAREMLIDQLPKEMQKNDRGSLRQTLKRGRDALSEEYAQRPKNIRPSIEGQFDKVIIENALKELSKRKV